MNAGLWCDQRFWTSTDGYAPSVEVQDGESAPKGCRIIRLACFMVYKPENMREALDHANVPPSLRDDTYTQIVACNAYGYTRADPRLPPSCTYLLLGAQATAHALAGYALRNGYLIVWTPAPIAAELSYLVSRLSLCLSTDK